VTTAAVAHAQRPVEVLVAADVGAEDQQRAVLEDEEEAEGDQQRVGLQLLTRALLAQ
jgi:hypothetical protein